MEREECMTGREKFFEIRENRSLQYLSYAFEFHHLSVFIAFMLCSSILKIWVV